MSVWIISIVVVIVGVVVVVIVTITIAVVVWLSYGTVTSSIRGESLPGLAQVSSTS